MGVVPLARYQSKFSGPAQVRDCHGVGLRPRIVDDVLGPRAAAVRVLFLLVPENPVAVGHAGDKIGQAVTVNVFHVDEPDRT